MQYKLFDFMQDEHYKLMLDMAKELHTEEESRTILERFQNVDLNVFFSICKEHFLDGVVGAYAISLGARLPDEWGKAYWEQKCRQEFLKEKAKEVCSAMDAHGIAMVILKNGGIMLSMVNEAVKCPMEDIDSLIKKRDFFAAHQILSDMGFVFKFRSEYEEDSLEKAFRHGSAEYYLPMPDGSKMWFELSWRAIDGRWIRPDMEPDTDEFIDRSGVVKGTRVHVLSKEDNLLQVCIHTAKHSYVRAPGLRLHMDVDRIVAHNEIDWELFLKKVKETHVCKSTYLSLYIPTVMFGTNVPEWVLDELRSRSTDRLLAMLGRAGLPHPDEKKFNKIQFLMFQTALYDSVSDMWHTLYPNRRWMQEHYGCKNTAQIVGAIMTRGLDLVGIRRKKQ